MKAILFLLVATVANAAAIYKCQFDLGEKNGRQMIMTGHIMEDETVLATYLTLQPVISSRLPFDARVLLTSTGYNPLTIHPRGNTAKALAHTTLNLEGTTVLEHVDTDGKRYVLSCSKQN